MSKALLQLADLAWPKVIGIGLVVTAGYYFGMRDDGSAILASLQNQKQEFETATKQLAATKKAMENAERFEIEIKAAKAQFERVSEFMPPRLSTADLTTLMSEKAAKAGVRLLSTSPKTAEGNDTAKSTFFDSLRILFKIEGSFAQILTFLSQVSRDSRMLTFDNTDLMTVTGSQVDDPTLTFSGELVGYRFKKEALLPEAPVDGQTTGQAPGAGGASAAP